ncbi:MAG: pectate lyase [Opitutia bacterium]
MRTALTLLLLLALAPVLAADESPRRYLRKPEAWYASDEARRIAANILSFQTDAGGWPKNTDTVSAPYRGDRSKLQPTFDNKGTLDELRYLARMFVATKDAEYRRSFDRGLAYVLSAQYANGGWPQFFPLRKGYYDRITFNDGAMAGVLTFVREVGREEPYAFVDAKTRASCLSAFDLGIACILKCQIVVDGRPTVWCAQHDEKTFAPAKARAYELPSFSGQESVGITRLLMSLDRPSPEVKAAVEGAVAWLDAHRIRGIRVEEKSGLLSKDRVVVEDPKAPDLWARFYDLRTAKPFFCSRDGIPRENLSEISHERRNGYSWYGEYARDLLTKDYPAWKKKQGL